MSQGESSQTSSNDADIDEDSDRSNKLLMSYMLIFAPGFGFGVGGIVFNNPFYGAMAGILLGTVVISLFTTQIKSALDI